MKKIRVEKARVARSETHIRQLMQEDWNDCGQTNHI